MLFQKEKNDSNQIDRLDQKRKALSEKKIFPVSPDNQESAFWKSIPVYLSK